jgi:cytosine/adenosine deaminase-related metal-dependent hydrolase
MCYKRLQGLREVLMGGTLIRGGTVVTVDPALGNLERGDVLVDGSKIAAVGEDLEAPGAEVIDAGGKVVIPGFVEAHRHIWQGLFRHVSADWSLFEQFMFVMRATGPRYSAEDLYAATLLGRVEALDAGITTLLDWNHLVNTPEHADAAVQALKELPARSVFGYGGSNEAWSALPTDRSDIPMSDDLRRVRSEHFPNDDGLVTLTCCVRGPEFSTEEVTAHDIGMGRDLGLRISVHVGNGDFGINFPSLDILQRLDLLGDDTTYIHCSSCTDEHLGKIADTGGATDVSPANEMTQGHGFPSTGRLMRYGLRPSLSTDNTGTSAGDMFNMMRTAMLAERILQYTRAREAGEEPTILKAADALEFGTLRGAVSNGLEDRVGSITVGKEADLVLIDASRFNLRPLTNPIGSVVLSAETADVDTVLVAGKVVKQGGRLVGIDVDAIEEKALAAKRRIAEAAGVPEFTLDWSHEAIGLG